MILLDANVLIAAYDSGHAKHELARTLLEEAFDDEDAVGVPWVSILAFIRIGTSKRVYERPRSIDESCKLVGTWIARENVVTIGPGPKHWEFLQRMLVDGQASANLSTDAHLAAMALENGATLVTSDRDFYRFPDLKIRWLGE